MTPMINSSNLDTTGAFPKAARLTSSMEATARKVERLLIAIVGEDLVYRPIERAGIKSRMAYTHTCSEGFKHRYEGPLRSEADFVLELSIDLRNAILHDEQVKNFKINLHDHTCSYTQKDGTAVVIDLDRHSNKDLRELATLYFKEAEKHVAKRRHKLDAAGNPINGRSKLPLTPQILKAETPYLEVKQKGFYRALELTAHYGLRATDPQLRQELAQRYAFSDLMHKQLENKFTKLVEAKEKQLKGALPTGQKKQLEAQLAYLKAVKAELENLDFFAAGLALSNFPKIRHLAASEGALQMEKTLEKKIEQNKKQLEKELRDENGYHLTAEEKKEKDAQQFAYEDQYIRDNCLGLFSLSYATRREHARAQKLATPKCSLENLFVKEALCFDPIVSFKGEGFKTYLKETLPKDDDTTFAEEIDKLVEETAADLFEAFGTVALPDFTGIAPVPNSFRKGATQAHLDAREQIVSRIEQYTLEIGSKLSSK